MKMPVALKHMTLLFTALFFVFSASTAFAEDIVKIGVLAKRGSETALKKWVATAEYLSEKTGKKVRIQPLKFQEVPIFLKGKKVDFFLVNSSMFSDMKNQFGGEAIASLVNSRRGNALNQFGGVLFVKADSSIKSLADIKGKTFMAVKKSSFGGYQMAQRLLLNNGVNPEKDTKLFKEGGTHDKVVEMVSKGVIEVGTVRTDTLERMAAEGKVDMAALRILNEQKDDFPFVRSTQLYPEWPMAAAAGTDPALVAQVKEALLSMSADSAAAKAAKIVGWSAPLDYGTVEECLKELKFGSFK
ncbi:MAG: phosphate/phosphite/phosphonate ABC transporter substrate-binding protein [Deltaproteobacteria bacterium]|jgi:twitching motility protein PilJ|nr:phosphate/phosphite/phosphonate ABC transporter substrate-binding protein [Deltaproteobacteria bacterium]